VKTSDEGKVTYLDASALVKLVVRERESRALRSFLRSRTWVSSAVSRTELLRAVRRHDARLLKEARTVIETVELVSLDDQILDAAARVDPPTLRTLDAIHLASALAFEGDLDSFVTYDFRMADGARFAGIVVEVPA
jgi:predicted nucleic acid-binding protein